MFLVSRIRLHPGSPILSHLAFMSAAVARQLLEASRRKGTFFPFTRVKAQGGRWVSLDFINMYIPFVTRNIILDLLKLTD